MIEPVQTQRSAVMTTINRRWDAGLGRYRDPYPHEIPWAFRARPTGNDDRTIRAGQRRAQRDAAERARRATRQRGAER